MGVSSFFHSHRIISLPCGCRVHELDACQCEIARDRETKFYLSATVEFESVEAALAKFSTYSRTKRLERHRDGTASVVFLKYEPVQPGQFPWIGTTSSIDNPTSNPEAS